MRLVRRALVPLMVLIAVYYAVFGGEYSIFELRAARTAVERERAELARLQREIDSLRAWVDSLESDSATIERIAREEFGMIREGETLYRFAEPDSVALPDSSDAPTRRP